MRDLSNRQTAKRHSTRFCENDTEIIHSYLFRMGLSIKTSILRSKGGGRICSVQTFFGQGKALQLQTSALFGIFKYVSFEARREQKLLRWNRAGGGGGGGGGGNFCAILWSKSLNFS